MASENETIADIIAEMKREAAQIFPALPIAVLRLATRIEAAHKRERGDCAKLREALKKCLLYIACAESVGVGTITLNDKVKLIPKKIIKLAKKALAATEKEGGEK